MKILDEILKSEECESVEIDYEKTVLSSIYNEIKENTI